jgi:hypothetical protein
MRVSEQAACSRLAVLQAAPHPTCKGSCAASKAGVKVPVSQEVAVEQAVGSCHRHGVTTRQQV